MLWSLLAALGVGSLYYSFALIGVHFLSLPSGIVVFWPPNAVVLAAFLTLPIRDWPQLSLAPKCWPIIPVFPSMQLCFSG